MGIVQVTLTMELETGEPTDAAIERESDVDQLVHAISDPVQLRGGPVAERCTGARIEQRSPQPLGASELAGGGAVDAEMHSLPPTSLKMGLDPAVADTDHKCLGAGQYARPPREQLVSVGHRTWVGVGHEDEGRGRSGSLERRSARSVEE